MKDFFSFLSGALIGAAIGAGIVIFTTPKTGDETRQDLQNRWHEAIEQGKQAARQREQQLWADFNTRVKASAGIPINQATTVEQTSPPRAHV